MPHFSTTTSFLNYARRGALLLVLMTLLRPLGTSAQAVVSTLAGGGTSGSTAGSTDGTGVAALFNAPTSVAVDGAGNVYVADLDNNRIRKVSPAGVVSTLAGGGTTGRMAGSTDGMGSSALFYFPTGMAVDGAGTVYVADIGNRKIRTVSPAGVVSTLAGGGANGTTSGSTNGTGTAALFYYPRYVAVDGAGNVYVGDFGNHKIRKVSATALSTASGLTAAQVALYPNPARSSFTVQLPAGLVPGPAELLNSLGQVVRRPAGAAPRFTVETAGLAPGIYTLGLGAAGTVARRVVVE